MAIRAGNDNRGRRRGGKGWRPELATTVGKRREQQEVVESGGQAIVVAVTERTSVAVADETTLNSLITRVILREIVISDSGATKRTALVMAILQDWCSR